MLLGLQVLAPAEDARALPLVSVEHHVVGARLRVERDELFVPKDIPGSVGVWIDTGSEDPGTNAAVGKGAHVEAVLRGPAFPAYRLLGFPNEPLMLPPIPLVGEYEIDDIRLVRTETNEILMMGAPSRDATGATMLLVSPLAEETPEATVSLRGGYRGPGSGARIVSPPEEGQVVRGGSGNPSYSTVFEGHGSELPGTFTMPPGTYLRLPEITLLSEEQGQAAAISGTFPPEVQSRVIPPGGRTPNLVLEEPTPNMYVRPNSTYVRRPTLLKDLLEPDMGMCTWAACRRPARTGGPQ